MASSLKSRMKVLTIIGIFLIGIYSASAQDGDSLRTQFLSEVVIEAPRQKQIRFKIFIVPICRRQPRIFCHECRE